MKDKVHQLFLAVEKGKTSKVEKLLAQNVDVNARDERDGSTSLIRAARGRNFVVQKELLSSGADPKLKDKFGLTPLHYVAEAGDVESLKLFIAMGAPIDAKDLVGCSPLHYSVDRGKVSAVDLLLFCGADVSCVNKKGESPLSVAKRGKLRNLLENAASIHEGIINGDIRLEHKELSPNIKSVLRDIDLEIETTEKFSVANLSFLCRRVRPEYCSNENILPKARELLISDIFEYRTSSTRFSGLVRVGVPLHAYPEPYEDVYLKSDRGVEGGPIDRYTGIKRNERSKGKLRWTCIAEVDITKVKSFVMVTLPRVEYFRVESSGGTFFSDVDKFLQIKVQANTFNSGKISLEVIPSPIYKQETFEDVVSIGHFYDMNHSSHVGPFAKDGVGFTMPIPNDFEGDGELCILGANLSSNYDFNKEEDRDTVLGRWEIIERKMNPRRGRISCGLSHFSIYVPMERREHSSDDMAKINADKLLRRSMKRESFLKFFVLSKPATSYHHAVVECTSPQKLADRISHWMSLGYLKNKEFNSESGDVETMDRQEYQLELIGNIKSKFDFPCIKLQFHAKRENYQNLQLTVIDKEDDAMGFVYVYPKEEDDAIGNALLNLPITLYDSMVKELPVHEEKGFLNDSFLRRIAGKLGSPAWIQVCVFLGLSFQTIEDFRSQPTTPRFTTEDKIYKILREWREKCKNRDDKGLPDLVLALHRVDRRDLKDQVIKDLGKWVDKENVEKDAFYQWARQSTEKPNSTVENEEDDIEPMSDIFLVTLVRKYGQSSFRHLGIYMDLNENQISNVMDDSTIPGAEMKLTRILVMARNKIGDNALAFQKLADALLDSLLMEARDWMIESARKWCEKGTEKVTKFKLDITKMLKELEGKGTDRDTEEEEERSLPVSDNESSSGFDDRSEGSVDFDKTHREEPSIHSTSPNEKSEKGTREDVEKQNKETDPRKNTSVHERDITSYHENGLLTSEQNLKNGKGHEIDYAHDKSTKSRSDAGIDAEKQENEKSNSSKSSIIEDMDEKLTSVGERKNTETKEEGLSTESEQFPTQNSLTEIQQNSRIVQEQENGDSHEVKDEHDDKATEGKTMTSAVDKNEDEEETSPAVENNTTKEHVEHLLANSNSERQAPIENTRTSEEKADTEHNQKEASDKHESFPKKGKKSLHNTNERTSISTAESSDDDDDNESDDDDATA